MSKTAIIIGAGPAGLTAAYELLHRTDIKPIILEKSGDIGGISKTIEYKGNRMDMGPHRFFSKSDRVMNWWLNLFPIEAAGGSETITVYYQNRKRTIDAANSGEPVNGRDRDKVMLVIQRLTRIYFLRKFFAYPVQLSLDTLKTLGLMRTVKIITSYIYSRLFPRRPVKSLEDYIINQFGRQLYLLFFKDYTEKVWGVSCDQISAEWGAQRIKGVSLNKAISHAIQHVRKKKGDRDDIGQKEMETSLIEQFLYPKRGPGQLWEEVARQLQEMGCQVYLNQEVQEIDQVGQAINAVRTINSQTGQAATWEGDYFFSTMPVKELIRGMGGPVPNKVKEVAAGLQYRDFINVGLLLRQLSASGKDGGAQKLMLKDNWIYIQERDVKVGRLMIYNNWGTGMVKDPSTVWIGMEYFCNKSDTFWALSDEAIRQTAIWELVKMGLARSEDVLDGTVARMEKTYPAYFGTYDRFDEIRGYLDEFTNLFLIGRNGMHKYNNADHSMLTAMVAVDNILAGTTSKVNLWAINTEQEYHEKKLKAETNSKTEKISNSTKEPIPSISFAQYFNTNPTNKVYVLYLSMFLIVEFCIFKILYPFADYFHTDSFAYVDAANQNSDIGMWPIGYSKFLRIFTTLFHSDYAVTGFQFIFLCASVLYLLFSLSHFFKDGNTLLFIIIPFLLLDPVLIYISNAISSDSLFCSLSLLWFTNLLWLAQTPRLSRIIVNALLIFLLFTIRYNSIYYPIVASIAILFAKTGWKIKLIAIAAPLTLIFLFANMTKNEYQKTTGTKQLSAFGGWQVANNALYMYSHIYQHDVAPIPKKYRKLHKIVQNYFDTVWGKARVPADNHIGIFYLWENSAPLKKYMNSEWMQYNDSISYFFKVWSEVSPIYLGYGSYLIRMHPMSYAKYFLLPNIRKYAVPPLEFMDKYNTGFDSVDQMVKGFFNYKSAKISCVNSKLQGEILTPYPVIYCIVNLYFLVLLMTFYSLGIKSFDNEISSMTILVFSFWFLNLLFSITASPIVFRYQLTQLIIGLPFTAFFANYLLKESAHNNRFRLDLSLSKKKTFQI